MKTLSQRASTKLAKFARTETTESVDSLSTLFIKHGMTPFEPVLEAFLQFGGYCIPFPLEGRFKIYRAKIAIRQMSGPSNKSTDPSLFRMPFGQSETIQSYYLIDGHGVLYENDTRVADSVVDWIEDWAK